MAENESIDDILKEFLQRVRAAARVEYRDELVAELLSKVTSDTAAAGGVTLAPVKGRAKAHANGIKPATKPRTKPKMGPAKRTPDDVTAAAAKVMQFINDNPAKRAEEIAKATGLTTKELKAPIRVLIKNEKIKFTGKARGTAYSAK